MDPQIEKWSKKITKLKEKTRDLEAAISAIQRVCKHNMKYYGEDSHYRYEKCTECGFEDRY